MLIITATALLPKSLMAQNGTALRYANPILAIVFTEGSATGVNNTTSKDGKMIQHIDVGFLTGNLWEGASVREYKNAILQKLMFVYPGVDITITSEPGSGSPPLSTQTRVYDVSGNRMENEEQSVNLLIIDLDTEICENPDHPVWAEGE